MRHPEEREAKLKELSKTLNELFPNNVGHGGGYLLISMESNHGTEAEKDSPFRMGLIYNLQHIDNLIACSQAAYVAFTRMQRANFDPGTKNEN